MLNIGGGNAIVSVKIYCLFLFFSNKTSFFQQILKGGGGDRTTLPPQISATGCVLRHAAFSTSMTFPRSKDAGMFSSRDINLNLRKFLQHPSIVKAIVKELCLVWKTDISPQKQTLPWKMKTSTVRDISNGKITRNNDTKIDAEYIFELNFRH